MATNRVIHPVAAALVRHLRQWRASPPPLGLFSQKDIRTCVGVGAGFFAKQTASLSTTHAETMKWEWRKQVVATHETFADPRIHVGFAIYLPELLKTLLDENRVCTQHMAYDLLLAAAKDPELILEIDPVLSDLLERWGHMRPDKTVGLFDPVAASDAQYHLPFATNPTVLKVFRAHLERLLNYNPFIEKMCMHAIRHTEELQLDAAPEQGYCNLGTRHVGYKDCVDCGFLSWARGRTGVFALDKLTFPASHGPIRFPKIPLINSVDLELNRIAEVATPLEGVMRLPEKQPFGARYLVDFRTFLETTFEINPQSCLMEFMPQSAAMTPETYYLGAVNACKFFKQAYRFASTLLDPFTPRETAVMLRWTPPELGQDGEVFAFFSETKLQELISQRGAMRERVSRMRLRRLHADGAARAPARIIVKDYAYTATTGPTVVPVRVTVRTDPLRKSAGDIAGMKRYYYADPFPETQERLDRIGRKFSAKVDGEYMWNLDFFKSMAAISGDADGKPSYPWYVALRDWAQAYEDSQPVATWAKQLYDLEYTARVLTHESTTKLKGKPYMGRWSAQEDTLLTQLADQRVYNAVAAGSSACGPMTVEDIMFIEGHLAHRSKKKIIERMTELGFELAKRTSYATYINSGYAFKASSMRRREWLRKGVKAV